ncbi:MAG: 50S ribosomal protein L5 [Microgenomates group bacterium GW2011_GWF2_45_18]|nr:MAG: 50S ribosomal protein L5 [Microgenomates group bacterium GW2011_GWF1_44_10]KKU01979.1 MAG: 50S ribosomal protein L5 [Microgenomates group bacterium GW2011_GWF2_45_18]OGJ41007.1 MAG: 50S ribosomal protein L5 [Candidatus Pacebacteria bacterium RIFOXYB1_FULL_44_10]HAU99036.1 50S ribosomal protein L5 [Candidatus Paceibacterota bacterium]HAX01249.1 50S ribosomal protein L5 [Candidatus Paceibacterota bacterium]
MNRLKQQYNEKVAPELMKVLNKKNVMSLPKITKILVHVGVGTREANQAKALESVREQLQVIAGQKPKTTAAKQSIAGFKLRQGDPVGLVVTLRGERMWEFLDKLISIVLPRVKDFQGVRKNAFDQNGNYNLGITEQIVFPEIEYDKIDRIRGLQVTIATSTKKTEEARKLLELLGFPFEKEEN